MVPKSRSRHEIPPTTTTRKGIGLSGCSSVWPELPVWIRRVAGSNPAIPTNFERKKCDMRTQPILLSNLPKGKCFPSNVRSHRASWRVWYKGIEVTSRCYAFLSVLGFGYVDCFRHNEGRTYIEPGTDRIARYPRRWGRVKVVRT